MARIKLSEEGLRIVERNRQRKQWAKTERAWYELAFVSKSTLKRFLNRERITQELFVKICEVIGISNWEEVAENYLDQIDEDFGYQTTWCLVLSAQITEINKPEALAIIEHLKNILEEPKLTLKEVKEGSVVLVLSGSQDGFEWMYYLLKSGDVTQLLGIQILDVRLATVNLTQWFQRNFDEAIAEGWQTLTEIFGTTKPTPAFRSHAVKRAKQIKLGDRTIALILDLEKIDDQNISLFLGIFTIEEGIHLPEDLKIVVFFESGEPVEIPVNENLEGFNQEIFFSSGETFKIQVVSGENSIFEYFSI
jgi:Protein of unknown function (DUF1822)